MSDELGVESCEFGQVATDGAESTEPDLGVEGLFKKGSNARPLRSVFGFITSSLPGCFGGERGLGNLDYRVLACHSVSDPDGERRQRPPGI